MKLGVHFVNFTLPGGPEALGPVLGAAARAAEQAGCAKFTVKSTTGSRWSPSPRPGTRCWRPTRGSAL